MKIPGIVRGSFGVNKLEKIALPKPLKLSILSEGVKQND